mgnify:CR=1 FL=1
MLKDTPLFWHFPLIHPEERPSVQHMLWKLEEEIKEFKLADRPMDKAEEVLDILHAAETLVRKFFIQAIGTDGVYTTDDIIRRSKKKIIRKNRKRGYYK